MSETAAVPSFRCTRVDSFKHRKVFWANQAKSTTETATLKLPFRQLQSPRKFINIHKSWLFLDVHYFDWLLILFSFFLHNEIYINLKYVRLYNIDWRDRKSIQQSSPTPQSLSLLQDNSCSRSNLEMGKPERNCSETHTVYHIIRSRGWYSLRENMNWFPHISRFPDYGSPFDSHFGIFISQIDLLILK